MKNCACCLKELTQKVVVKIRGEYRKKEFKVSMCSICYSFEPESIVRAVKTHFDD